LVLAVTALPNITLKWDAPFRGGFEGLLFFWLRWLRQSSVTGVPLSFTLGVQGKGFRFWFVFVSFGGGGQFFGFVSGFCYSFVVWLVRLPRWVRADASGGPVSFAWFGLING